LRGKGLPDNKKTRETLFQVMLLYNDADLGVQVQEAEHVNFTSVKEHLQNGGSVFITSRKSQKITRKKGKAQTNYTASRKKIGYLIKATFRKQKMCGMHP
jgi:hypothetical protein